MIFTTPPDARPYSASYPLVMIWNSCTPSCDTVERMPFTELSTASMPSTFTALERALCPPKFSPDVGAAPMLGATSRCTWEFVSEKLT